MVQLTTEDFIAQSIVIHGEDVFDYSELEYVNYVTKVKLICKKCNITFEQKPYYHLTGRIGCPTCRESKRFMNLEQFISKAKKIHGEKYDYSKVKYIDFETKVIIICNACDTEFSQKPTCHLSYKHGCKKCANINQGLKRRTYPEEILKRMKSTHKDKYDYSESIITRMHDKIKIKCNTCNHIFYQAPSEHIHARQGCPKCAGKMLKTPEEFIKQAIIKHGNLYKYDRVKYKSGTTEVEIYCTKCKKYFMQIPKSHLNGSGCKFHMFKTQKKLLEFLEEHFDDVYTEQIFEGLKLKRFDFYLHEYNLVIECDGPQHFRQVKDWNLEKTKESDQLKMQFCLENEINVIRLLQEDIWNDKYDWRYRLLKYIEECKKQYVIKFIDTDDTYENNFLPDDYLQYENIMTGLPVYYKK